MNIYSAMLFRYERMALYLALYVSITCISMNLIKNDLVFGHRAGDIDFYEIDADFRGVAQKFRVGVGGVATPRTVNGAFAIHRDLLVRLTRSRLKVMMLLPPVIPDADVLVLSLVRRGVRHWQGLVCSPLKQAAVVNRYVVTSKTF